MGRFYSKVKFKIPFSLLPPVKMLLQFCQEALLFAVSGTFFTEVCEAGRSRGLDWLFGFLFNHIVSNYNG